MATVTVERMGCSGRVYEDDTIEGVVRLETERWARFARERLDMIETRADGSRHLDCGNVCEITEE